jgi:prevent-host-death family protein
MGLQSQNTISITQARSSLSNLIAQIKLEKETVVTKRGRPAVVLVDPDYLAKLKKNARKLVWAQQFKLLTDKAREKFTEYLQQQGYSRESLTDEEAMEILANL